MSEPMFGIFMPISSKHRLNRMSGEVFVTYSVASHQELTDIVVMFEIYFLGVGTFSIFLFTFSGSKLLPDNH